MPGTQLDPEGVPLSETSQMQKTRLAGAHLHVKSRKNAELLAAESRMEQEEKFN